MSVGFWGVSFLLFLFCLLGFGFVCVCVSCVCVFWGFFGRKEALCYIIVWYATDTRKQTKFAFQVMVTFLLLFVLKTSIICRGDTYLAHLICNTLILKYFSHSRKLNVRSISSLYLLKYCLADLYFPLYLSEYCVWHMFLTRSSNRCTYNGQISRRLVISYTKCKEKKKRAKSIGQNYIFVFSMIFQGQKRCVNGAI